jgi:hypothetical protein
MRIERKGKIMNVEKLHRFRGVSLIEAMIAITVLVIAVLGASGYRYYSSLDVKRADMRATASRIGMLLCESWRGVKGDEDFDPTVYSETELTITEISMPDSLEVDGFEELGAYEIQTDNVSYYAALSYDDVSDGLRAMNIVIAWAQRQQSESAIADADKRFSLTTYTEVAED